MFRRFPQIKTFAEAVAEVERQKVETCSFTPKIQIGGCGVAVRIEPDGTVRAQKKNADISERNDNFGFGRWVDENAGYFQSLKADETIWIYGEWAGPGVQGGLAVSLLNQPKFFVYAAMIPLEGGYVVEPVSIATLLNSGRGWRTPSEIDVLPWACSNLKLWFKNRDKLSKKIEAINAFVAFTAEEDPYIQHRFGVYGPGYGLVWYPTGAAGPERKIDMHRFALTFATRGDQGQVKQIHE